MMTNAFLSFSNVTVFAYSIVHRCSSWHVNVKEIQMGDYNEWMVCGREVTLA